jgi:hypothetical protein
MGDFAGDCGGTEANAGELRYAKVEMFVALCGYYLEKTKTRESRTIVRMDSRHLLDPA